MLTADLVRARKRAGKLYLTPLKERGRAVALACAQAYMARAEASVGRSRSELMRLLDEFPVSARDRKIALRNPEARRGSVPVRRAYRSRSNPCAPGRVYQSSDSSTRPKARLPFRSCWGATGRQRSNLGVQADEIEVALYADLKQAQTLRQLDMSDPEALVERYEVSQAQAVLLRATRVEARVCSHDPRYYRDLFRKLKFRRLLHTIHPDDDGYRIVVDGPMSLFSSATKYGLSLALVLPAIQAGSRWAIDAELLWGARLREALVSAQRKSGNG